MDNVNEPLKTSRLKALAKQQLKGNWGKAILAFLVFIIITDIPSAIPYAGFAISLVISGPMCLGITKFSIELKRGQSPSIETIFSGFKSFATSFLLQLTMGIFIFLWSLLLIVPGIIASLRYSMAFYILNDNPELSAMEALNKSKEMMVGYKGKLFLLYLSFIGWGLLSILTLGIGFIWLIPYINITVANFYDELKNKSNPNIIADGNPSL